MIPGMAKRLHSLYDWQCRPGEKGRLERVGSISEAKLWAWEYRVAGDEGWNVGSSGEEPDTVRIWRTDRPDLGPASLLVGERVEN